MSEDGVPDIVDARVMCVMVKAKVVRGYLVNRDGCIVIVSTCIVNVGGCIVNVDGYIVNDLPGFVNVDACIVNVDAKTEYVLTITTHTGPSTDGHPLQREREKGKECLTVPASLKKLTFSLAETVQTRSFVAQTGQFHTPTSLVF